MAVLRLGRAASGAEMRRQSNTSLKRGNSSNHFPSEKIVFQSALLFLTENVCRRAHGCECCHVYIPCGAGRSMLHGERDKFSRQVQPSMG